MPIQSFSVSIPDSDLQDVASRLERVRWPDEIAGSGWGYGADLSTVKEWAAYWKDEFDFLKEHCDVVYLSRTKDISTSTLKSKLP